MGGSALRAWLLVGLWVGIGGSLSQAQQPLTLSIVPIGGTEIDGGGAVSLEVFLTVNTDTCTSQPPGPTNPNGVRIEGGQIDLPCSLPGGASGTISIVNPGTQSGATTDPDGDGLRGPSSGGIPFLFGTNGFGFFQPASCLIALTPNLGNGPMNLTVGETRYLGTFFYRAGVCAAGDFNAGFEGITHPPVANNSTRFRDDCPAGGTGGLLLAIDDPGTTLSVPVGQCCRGRTCLGEANEHCCRSTLFGNTWEPGLTCDDDCPCRLAADCDDANPCTSDSCSGGLCLHVEDVDRCDDGDNCTLDHCDSRSGFCRHTRRCLYGDLAPEIPDCVVDADDFNCVLDGFAVMSACANGDVFPCLGDDEITFDDLLALMAAAEGQPACPDPIVCE